MEPVTPLVTASKKVAVPFSVIRFLPGVVIFSIVKHFSTKHLCFTVLFSITFIILKLRQLTIQRFWMYPESSPVYPEKSKTEKNKRRNVLCYP
jgi:hypothetical protein